MKSITLKTFLVLLFSFNAHAEDPLPAPEAATSSGGGIIDSAKEMVSDALSPLQKALEADPKEVISNCNLEEGASGTPVCEQLSKFAKELENASITSPVPRGPTLKLLSSDDLNRLKTAISTYESKVKTCHKNQLLASKVCLASKNNDLQDQLSAITAVGALTSATSTNQACSATGKMMGLATSALTAYQATCTAAKSICLPACGSANKALLEFQFITDKAKLNPEIISHAEAVSKVPAFAAQAGPIVVESRNTLASYKGRLREILAQELNAKDFSTTSGKLSVCSNKYAQLLGTAAAGIKGMMAAKKSADACANDSSGVAMNLDEKCKLSQHKNSQECICHLSPRTPGCANNLEKIGSENSGLAIGSTGETKDNTTNKDLSPGDLGGRSPTAAADNNKSGSGGSSGGMPLAGGLGSSTAGSGGGAAGSGSNGVEPFPGSYSYDDSGAGGGGWGSGGGGSWGIDGMPGDSGLEAYLPEGEKDPNAVSALSEMPADITPEGGKSNFEKVRQIYGEVRSTLLDK